MTIAYLDEILNVADIAALKALVAPQRKDGSFRFVKNPSGGLPPSFYYYKADGSGSELLPTYVTPNDSVGRWQMVNGGVYYSNTAPIGAPPVSGIIWIAALASPTRTVMWISTGSQALSDWLPMPLILELTVDPSFNADYIGQKVINTTSKVSWVAVDRTGTWVKETNEIITLGSNITANYTIQSTDAGLWRTITAASVITLPANLATKFSCTLQRDLASGAVTIAAGAGATIKAKGLNISANGAIVELYNLGTGVWIAKGDLS